MNLTITGLDVAQLSVIVTTIAAVVNSVTLACVLRAIANFGRIKLYKEGHSHTGFMPRETGIVPLLREIAYVVVKQRVRIRLVAFLLSVILIVIEGVLLVGISSDDVCNIKGPRGIETRVTRAMCVKENQYVTVRNAGRARDVYVRCKARIGEVESIPRRLSAGDNALIATKEEARRYSHEDAAFFDLRIQSEAAKRFVAVITGNEAGNLQGSGLYSLSGELLFNDSRWYKNSGALNLGRLSLYPEKVSVREGDVSVAASRANEHLVQIGLVKFLNHSGEILTIAPGKSYYLVEVKMTTTRYRSSLSYLDSTDMSTVANAETYLQEKLELSDIPKVAMLATVMDQSEECEIETQVLRSCIVVNTTSVALWIAVVSLLAFSMLLLAATECAARRSANFSTSTDKFVNVVWKHLNGGAHSKIDTFGDEVHVGTFRKETQDGAVYHFDLMKEGSDTCARVDKKVLRGQLSLRGDAEA